ncbi:MAG: hypothetical protein NC335_04035 [Bacteroides sp.]|nr:hypothetical protein [Bacteroides sp.]
MKFFFAFMLVMIPSIMNGQSNDSVSNIHDEYDAGRRIVKEIISKNNLESSLEGCAYGCYFIGTSLFLVIKEGESFFETYQGKRDEGILNVYRLSLNDKCLGSLFAWAKKDSVIYDIQSNDYSPLYYYFILYDKCHDPKIEFNISTMSASKNAKKSERHWKSLPFTKEQQELIMELILGTQDNYSSYRK